jgi:hypothetical protein
VTSGERALELSRARPDASRSAALHAILSMAQHRLGQTTDARKSLAEATKLFDENWPRVTEGKLGSSWHNVLIAHLLTREARTLIETTAQSVAP